MRRGQAHRYHPRRKAYDSITCFEQFEVCQELILEEEEKRGDCDLDEVAFLTQELHVAKRLCMLESPMWDITHNLVVRDEWGDVKLFTPRYAQECFLLEYERAMAAKEALRALAPKPRRLGWSEAGSNCGHVHVWRNEGFHGIFIGQNADDSASIFSKYQLKLEHDPHAPPLTYLSKTYIEAEMGSSFTVRTAGVAVQKKSGVGRGNIFHFLHGSEVGFWPDQAIRMMTGILSTMPRWPVWQTVALLESTGNGRDGYFYLKVREALDSEDSPWKVMFLPWTDLHDCVLPFEGPEGELQKRRLEEELHSQHADEEEKALFFEHGATLEMINWRRWAIAGNLVDGVDFEERKRNFYQEYPLTIDDCFQSWGANTFDHGKITRQMRQCISAPHVGELTSPNVLWTRGHRGHVPVTPMPNFRKSKEGKVHVWRRPEPGREYVIGVDPSHGLALGDPSCAWVMERAEERLVCEWRDFVDQEDCLTPVRLLSKWYNDGIINVEVNLGRMLIKWLRGTDRRKFLFRRRDEGFTDVLDDVKLEYGFDINARTKRQLVSLLREQLENNPRFFVSVDLLGEMKDFRQELNTRGDDVIFPGVKSGSGRHDDRVLAAALCLAAHHFLRAPKPIPFQFGRGEPAAATVAQRWDVNNFGRPPHHRSRFPDNRRRLSHPTLGDDT